MYKKEAFEKFQNLLFNIKKETLARVIRTNFDFLLEEQPSPVVIL
jgi:preprotein translocase subunit SecA